MLPFTKHGEFDTLAVNEPCGRNGCIPVGASDVMKNISKFLMVTALAAIGLGTSITDLKKAGLAPMFYGITIDTLVTLTALAVVWCMGLM